VEKRDKTLDTLLDLDGQILVLDEKGEYWVKFEVRRVTVTPERPHGLDYSFTLLRSSPHNGRLRAADAREFLPVFGGAALAPVRLHGKDNERLVGFIMPMRSGIRRVRAAKARVHGITSMAQQRSALTGIAMPPHYWSISGPKWMPF
jgi:hypothetical protein